MSDQNEVVGALESNETYLQIYPKPGKRQSAECLSPLNSSLAYRGVDFYF